MWDLIVSVPDHCLSFYFSADHSHLLLPLTIYFTHLIPYLSIGRLNSQPIPPVAILDIPHTFQIVLNTRSYHLFFIKGRQFGNPYVMFD